MTTAAPSAGVKFAKDLAHHGDRLAVVDGDLALTYREVDERVQEVAVRLGGSGRLVQISGANRLEPLLVYLAALRSGNPVLLTPGDSGDAEDAALEAFDPDVIFSASDGWAMREHHGRRRADLHPDLALLLGTSGSTGSAKVVRLSGANLESNARSIAAYLGLTPADRAITSLPMSYCYGLSVINSHLAVGAALILTEESVTEPGFWDRFRRWGATSVAGVPYTYELLDRVGFDSMELPSLRYLTQAGGRMSPDRVKSYSELGARSGWELFVMYGQTEATARMAYLPPHLAGLRPESIGVPVPGGSFSIIDAGGNETRRGELVYRGPNVMMGYAQSRSDLSRGSELEELRTGDLAERDAEGLYRIVGRMSRFVKIYGRRLDLDDLERVVAQWGVGALCTGDDDRLVVGMAVSGPGSEGPSVTDLEAMISARTGLPRWRIHVVEVDELPALPSGKPDYPALHRLVPGATGDRRFGRNSGSNSTDPTDVPGRSGQAYDGTGGANSRGTAGSDVAQLFASALGRPVGPDESFVSAGGDSLSYVEVSVGLEEILGSLPPDWHVVPVGRLSPQPTDRPCRFLRHVETGVALRAMATVVIVGTHVGLWHIRGGAHLLLGVAGANFARFQLRARNPIPGIARIAVPCFVWLGLVVIASDRFEWPHALLLHGLFGSPADPWDYWYVEALVQILVVVAAMLAIPRVRRLEREHGFGFAVGLLAIALAVRFDVVPLPDLAFPMARPHEIAWIFALGWAVHRAGCRRDRLLLSAVVLAATPGFFPSATRNEVVMAGMLVLLWVPRIPLPRPANRLAGVLASASLYVYLTHWAVYPPVSRSLGRSAAVVGSLVVGVVTWLAIRRISAGVEARGRRRRPLGSPIRVPVPGTLGCAGRRELAGVADGRARSEPGPKVDRIYQGRVNEYAGVDRAGTAAPRRFRQGGGRGEVRAPDLVDVGGRPHGRPDVEVPPLRLFRPQEPQ